MGSFKKGTTREVRRGGRYTKMLTNGDIGGGAYVQMVTSRQYFFSINIFFKDHDIDYLIAACNAAGSSAFHFIERRMAPLSKELPGIVLPHDSFGTHLDENGKTIDDVKEPQNFRKDPPIPRPCSLQLQEMLHPIRTHHQRPE